MNRRMPALNPKIQLVVVYRYTKYEQSILNGCGDIFDEIVLRNYERMDRPDGRTDRCKPVYPPFISGGITTVALQWLERLKDWILFISGLNFVN